MAERRITKTTIETRIVMTLFVTIGSQDLTRKFKSAWAKTGELTVDPNRMHREVETAFRDLCQTWGIEKAEGLIISEDETRTTEYVTEVDSTLKSGARNNVYYDKLADEIPGGY